MLAWLMEQGGEEEEEDAKCKIGTKDEQKGNQHHQIIKYNLTKSRSLAFHTINHKLFPQYSIVPLFISKEKSEPQGVDFSKGRDIRLIQMVICLYLDNFIYFCMQLLTFLDWIISHQIYSFPTIPIENSAKIYDLASVNFQLLLGFECEYFLPFNCRQMNDICQFCNLNNLDRKTIV